MDRSGEALVPLLAAEEAVGRPEELVRRDRREQSAESAREEQGAGSRLRALPAHVDERHLEALRGRVEGADDEVAGERVSVGAVDRGLGRPAAGQVRQLPHEAQTVAQVDEDPVAADALHTDPGARAGHPEHQRGDGEEHDEGAEEGRPGVVEGEPRGQHGDQEGHVGDDEVSRGEEQPGEDGDRDQ